MDDNLFDDMEELQFQLGKEVLDKLSNQVNLFKKLSTVNDWGIFREQHENCENCQFYRQEECRRFPPTVWGDPDYEGTGSFSCNYPSVSHKDWCGEYRPTRESTEMLLEKLRGENAE